LTVADVVLAKLDRVVRRVDRVAMAWLLARQDLPRREVQELLERLAPRVGAKLELTDLG
jgi:hypothetical protein